MNSRFFILLLAILSVLSAAAQGKYALIIGNDDYRGNDFKPMTCCVNDANAMARCMSELGYDTIVVRNGDITATTQAITRFEKQLGKDDIAIFYFSGHGIEIDRTQYLLPTNTELEKSSGSLTRLGENLDNLKAELKSKCAISLLFIDACRESMNSDIDKASMTWKSKHNTKGATSDSSTQTRVPEQVTFYATGVNNVAYSSPSGLSPFTEVLIKYLAIDEDLMKIWIHHIAPEVERLTHSEPIPDGALSSAFRLRGFLFSSNSNKVVLSEEEYIMQRAVEILRTHGQNNLAEQLLMPTSLSRKLIQVLI